MKSYFFELISGSRVFGDVCSENCFMKTSTETYTLIMCLKLVKEVLNHSDENHTRLKEIFEMNV